MGLTDLLTSDKISERSLLTAELLIVLAFVIIHIANNFTSLYEIDFTLSEPTLTHWLNNNIIRNFLKNPTKIITLLCKSNHNKNETQKLPRFNLTIYSV